MRGILLNRKYENIKISDTTIINSLDRLNLYVIK